MELMFCLLLFFITFASAQTTGTLTLTIAYCPTLFTGAGALVTVDAATGNWTIKSIFDWPDEIIGCPLIYDAIVTFDVPSGLLYMYFTADDLLTLLDMNSGKVKTYVEPSDPFFTGFENMAWVQSENVLKGFSGIPDDNGRYQYGYLTTDGQYTGKAQLPFKAMMDDSHYYDEQNEIYWVQASYDQRPTICGPDDSSLCLLSVDASSGDLKNAVYTNFTIYKYGPQLGSVSTQRLAWMEGFEDLCQHPYNDYLFAQVDLMKASAKPIACIPQNVTVHMDEWICSFSLDGKLFATGSGDAETGTPQLLIFDTQTANTVLNSRLDGLAERLKSAENLFVIWSVDWVQ